MTNTCLLRGLFLVVCAHLASSQLSPVSAGESTKAGIGPRRVLSEKLWNKLLPRPYVLTSPQGKYLPGESPPFASISADREVYSDQDFSQELSSNGMDALEMKTATFVPYVGARALSNLREFFRHVKENLIASRLHELLKSKASKGVQSRNPEISDDVLFHLKNDVRTKNRAEHINLLPHEPTHSSVPLTEYTKDYYDPSWKFTNLGLGRRKRSQNHDS